LWILWILSLFVRRKRLIGEKECMKEMEKGRAEEWRSLRMVCGAQRLILSVVSEQAQAVAGGTGKLTPETMEGTKANTDQTSHSDKAAFLVQPLNAGTRIRRAAPTQLPALEG
jgi:hypothetical protein